VCEREFKRITYVSEVTTPQQCLNLIVMTIKHTKYVRVIQTKTAT